MGVPSIYVRSHDSIGLGEDGPTHQPVEQLASLRAIPGLDVVRPGDANEVGIAWKTILENHENPAGIVLTRQNVPTFARGEGASFRRRLCLHLPVWPRAVTCWPKPPRTAKPLTRRSS